MLKKDLEDKVIAQASEIFNLKQKLFQAEQFVEIGEERIEKVLAKLDKQLKTINKIKAILK